MPVGGMKSSGVEDKNSSSEAKPKLGNASEASGAGERSERFANTGGF